MIRQCQLYSSFLTVQAKQCVLSKVQLATARKTSPGKLQQEVVVTSDVLASQPSLLVDPPVR